MTTLTASRMDLRGLTDRELNPLPPYRSPSKMRGQARGRLLSRRNIHGEHESLAVTSNVVQVPP